MKMVAMRSYENIDYDYRKQMIVQLTRKSQFGVSPDWKSVKEVFKKARNVQSVPLKEQLE